MASTGTTIATAGARGLASGLAGTALMTAWQGLAARLRGSDGGDPEEPRTEGEAWEQAPAPAQVAAKVGEATVGSRPPARYISGLTQGMHWAYGTSWGLVYAAVRHASGGGHLARDGALLGTGVWAASYAQLVPAGLYSPPWKYPPQELALDLSYHLVYGFGVVAGHRALERI